MHKTGSHDTKNRVMTAAADLFNKKGFSATGISDIISESAIGKGNLYFHFKSKELLAADTLENAALEYSKLIFKPRPDRPIPEQIESIIMAVCRFHEKRGFDAGCLFGNLALETAGRNPVISDVIKKIFEKWISDLTLLITEAQTEGSVDPEISPDGFARHIVASLEGGIMLARITQNIEDLYACADQLIERLRNHKSRR